MMILIGAQLTLFCLLSLGRAQTLVYDQECSNVTRGTRCSCFRAPAGNDPATSCTQMGKRDRFVIGQFQSSGYSDCSDYAAGDCTVNANGRCEFTRPTPDPSNANAPGEVVRCGGPEFRCCAIRCGNGVLDAFEQCDEPNNPCCVNCRFASSTTVCRASTGTCDLNDFCTGSSSVCPSANAKLPDGAACDDQRATTHTDSCVDGICTSCADRKQCNDVKDISLTLPNGQLVCGNVRIPNIACRAPNLRINGWNATRDLLVNSKNETVDLDDFVGCFTPTFANNTLVGFTNAANGRSIQLSRNGQCWLKFVKPVVGSDNKRNALQATTTTVTISAAHLLPAVGGATGDPHITGPRGEHFEFQGRASHRYTMISSPKFLVNVQMSGERGGDVRFMTQVQIVVGKVEYFVSSIDLHQATQETFNGLNSLLAPHAANVTLFNRRHDGVVPLPPQLVLDVCGGQERVIITAIKPSARQVAAFKLFETTQYFNIEFEVDGCHDNFDGVIGQLYQCKYNAQPFVYDAAVVEQRFAVENFANNLPQFDPFFKCLQLQANDDIVGNAAAFQ